MTQIQKHKSHAPLYLMLITLPLALGAAYFIAQSYTTSIAYLVVIGILGFAVSLFSILFPVFGFYFTIIVSFFIFDIIRFLRVDMPVGSIVDAMMFLTFLGVLLNKLIRKESLWKNCRSPIVFLYLLLILYTIIEIFNPNGGSLVLYFLIIRRVITLFLFFYCAIQIFSELRDIHQFFKIFLVFSLIAALYACYTEWFGLPKYEMDYILANPLGEKLASLDNGNYRKASFLSDCTAFGLIMSASAAIMLAFLLELKNSFYTKLLFVLSIIFTLLAMSYTGTRTAIIMFIMEIALYIMMTLNNTKTIIFSGIFIAFVVIIVFGPIYGNTTINRIRTSFLFSKEESMKVRDVNRHSIQPYIYDHPIGGGLGTTGLISVEYNPNHPLAGFPTDSSLLRIALEYGWVGLLLQCLIYFIILQQGISAYFRSNNRQNKTLILASTMGLFGYIVAQYSQVAIGPIPGAFLFFALVAIIIRLRQMDQSTPFFQQ